MGRRPGESRVIGVYPNGSGFRVICADVAGARTSDTFRTREDADTFASAVRRELTRPGLLVVHKTESSNLTLQSSVGGSRSLIIHVNGVSTELHDLTHPTCAGVYYLLQVNRVKIGKSKNIAKRISELSTGLPHPPFLIASEQGSPTGLEQKAHRRWKSYRRHREWFAFEGELSTWLIAKNHEASAARLVLV